MNNRETLLISFSLIVFIPLVVIAVLSPKETNAISLFSPFGGKVTSWLPEAPGCSEITAAVSAATFGSVNITIEELKVGSPKGGTFGILRINGFIPPVLTTIYDHKFYKVPQTRVLGNYLDLCGSVPFVKDILGSAVTGAICGTVAGTCPISKIVHKIGTGSIGGF